LKLDLAYLFIEELLSLSWIVLQLLLKMLPHQQEILLARKFCLACKQRVNLTLYFDNLVFEFASVLL